MSTGPSDPGQRTMHASAVAVDGRALLIIGAPGAGKTTLAMEMIALGARLIADDRVAIADGGPGGLLLDAPPGLAGLAEIRGFGLIRLAATGPTPLALIADLDRPPQDRMPPAPGHRPDAPAPLPQGLPATAAPVMLCRGRTGLASVLTCILRATEWPDPEAFSLHDAAD